MWSVSVYYFVYDGPLLHTCLDTILDMYVDRYDKHDMILVKENVMEKNKCHGKQYIITSAPLDLQ